ncbi:MAG: chorismate mutase, partial [Candidatus Omnitrophica bacterium]|nr:chorismate mutase [Candidatus Omnitrophota bacterium]
TNLSLHIGKIKAKEGKGVYSPDRERQVLDKVKLASKGPISDCALEAIYREIMSASLAAEKSLKVAYLGPEATFANLAAIKRFGSQVEYMPCDSISDVFISVEREAADYGVVPIDIIYWRIARRIKLKRSIPIRWSLASVRSGCRRICPVSSWSRSQAPRARPGSRQKKNTAQRSRLYWRHGSIN